MKKTYLRNILVAGLVLLTMTSRAQYQITPEEGYSRDIGLMVDMLEDIKSRITKEVEDLSIEDTDFLFDDQANSIGALLMHLIANESYYRVESLEERHWTSEEAEFWNTAANLGEAARQKYQGKPIDYYLQLWDEERAKTLSGLKERDDAWFASDIDEGMNYYFVWYHVLEHTANHMRQIALVKNRLPAK
jgi:uncharacterized damage-inducible protein DinB